MIWGQLQEDGLKLLSKRIGLNGKVVAIDLLEVSPINGIDFIQGDFEQEELLNRNDET